MNPIEFVIASRLFTIEWLSLGQAALWLTFSVVWVIKLPRKKDEEDHVRDGSYNGSLYVTGTLGILFYVFRVLPIDPFFPFQKEFGLLLSALGLGFAIHARQVLGEFWTFTAMGRADGEFIEAFPYNRVRHPIYGAQLLMCLGTALTASNLATMLVFVIGSYFLLLLRARKEEQLLNRLSNGAYFERFSDKGRFFPRLPAGFK